uniref:Uncharacterized protein n=1 Tax=Knipowitschia caucasica TaxID=637954 RepID=A0AAV2JLE6_KNICA
MQPSLEEAVCRVSVQKEHLERFLSLSLSLSPCGTLQPGGETAPPGSTSPAPRPEEKKLMSKDSILSLYSSQPAGAPQPQVATGQVFPGQFAAGSGAVSNGGYMQPGAQPWAVSQMNQQMSSVSLSGPGSSPGAEVQSGPPAVASGQTLSTQLWK